MVRVGDPTEGRAAPSHPLLWVVAIAGAVALGHAAWIWSHRHLGAFDIDEAGYLASALRVHGALGSPLDLPYEVARSGGSGPLVPVLSVPLLVVGPDDPRTALLVQPLLLVATAVAAAGITTRLVAGPGAAIVAGATVAVLPTAVGAAATYQLGLGAATSLAAAMWALLASDRLRNRWGLAVGAGVAAMVLCRPMTLAFVPGIALAGLLVAGRDRRALGGLARAGAVALVVAGPWLVVQRASLLGYLTGYGYGDRAAVYGTAGVADRLAARAERVRDSVGPLWVVAAVVLVAAAWAVLRRHRPTWGGLRRHRGVAALLAVVLPGAVALASTSNLGTWFELPLVVLLVPLVVVAGTAAPRPVRLAAPVAVAGVAVAHLATAWWLVGPGSPLTPVVAVPNRTAGFEPALAEADPRFGSDRRDEHQAAAAEWAAASAAVADRLDAIGPGQDEVVTLVGSFSAFGTNTVQLAAQLDGWTVRTREPDTTAGPDEIADQLSPDAREVGGAPITDRAGRPLERVLVLVRTEQRVVPGDEDLAAFALAAAEAGWRPVDRVELPDGSVATVLRHPDRPAG